MVNVNIGIDCGSLAVKNEFQKTGVYRLSLNLLRELSKIDSVNNYLLYSFSPLDQKILAELGRNFQNIVLIPPAFYLTLRLSLEFLFHKPDLFIGLNQSLPLYCPCKSILFIYDLAFEHYPECYPKNQKKLSWQSKSGAKRAEKIITISQAVKKDLLKRYQIPKRKIKVIYPGVSKEFFPRKINNSKKYLLSVGSHLPIKNINSLMEAYHLLPMGIQKKYKLVIAGGEKFVPDVHLPSLYSGAKIFLSPSLYEGFGLPILEALSCGCPVVAGKNGSGPEVTGKAGLLVDPENIKDIKNKIEILLTDKKLYRKIKSQTRIQAKKFSLEKFGKEVYNEIAIMSN